MRALHLSSVSQATGVAAVRCQRGISLMECMVSLVIGSILMTAVYDSVSAMYTVSVSGQNQVLATNMASQVLDNARNTPYSTLSSYLNGSTTASQQLSLYTTPTTSPSFFPRPLLCNRDANSGMNYNGPQASGYYAPNFPGTVTETITEVQPPDPNNYTGEMRVTVAVNWTDSRGPHTFSASTNIAQSGVHN